MKTKKKNKKKDKSSKKSESNNDEEEEDKKDENVIIQKVHIYNNNRCLQKSSSAGNYPLFFEPYYSEIKNCTKNNLFKSKPFTKSIIMPIKMEVKKKKEN